MKLRMRARNGAGFLAGAAMACAALSGARAEEPAAGAEGAIEEVVTTSSRIATPLREVGTAVSVVTHEEMQLRGYHSVADVLRTQPGVGVSNSGGPGKSTTLRIRGEESYRTLVMIDGVDVSDPTAPQVGPSFDHVLTTSDIERIEILRGSQGFIYGADAGGVVNILTRAGEQGLRGELGLEAGAFGTRHADANVSGGGRAGDFFISVADVETEGFNSRVADDVLRDDDGYANTTVHAKLGLNVGSDLRLQLVARGIDAVSELDGCGFPVTHDCTSDTRQTTAKATIDYASGPLTHLFAYAETDIERRDFAGGDPAFATQGGITRIEYTGSAAASPAATFVYGLDLEREEVAAGGDARTRRGQDAVYFEYQGKFDERVFVTAGARYDDNDDFGAHTSVRATAAYLMPLRGGATLKYRAGIGTGFRAPSLFELAYNAGPFAFPPAAGLTLAEESSRGFDVGVDVRARQGLSFEATYFDQEIEDEIFFDLAAFSGYLQSLGRSRSRGIELAADMRIGTRFELLGSVTFNDAENTEGAERIRRPERLGSVAVRFGSRDGRLRLLAGVRWARDAVDEVFGLGRLPLDDYAVLDLSAAYAVGDSLEVFGRIENAANETYEEVAGYYSAGRNAHVGVRLRF